MTRVNSAQVKSEALPSRIVANFALAVVALARPPRAKLPAPPRRAVAAVLLTCMAIIASMFLLDRTASDWARHCRGWFIEAFEQITDFGLSGWFLFRSASSFSVSRRSRRPPRPALRKGVLAALGARFGFLFVAIGAARPVRDHRQAPDRPRAPLCRRLRQSVLCTSRSSGSRPTPACRPATRQRRPRPRSRSARVWPRARPLMWLYALIDHVQPRRRRRPSSERRDRRRAGRCGRRAAVAPPLCRAAACVFAARSAAVSGPSWRRLKAAARRRGASVLAPPAAD